MAENKVMLVIIVGAVLGACSPAEQNLGEFADLIFIGDNIITMDNTNVSAVAIRGDRIIATGNEMEILPLQNNSTRLVELGDQALLPGFIDAHGHFGAVATYSALLDLSSPPVGNITAIDDIAVSYTHLTLPTNREV